MNTAAYKNFVALLFLYFKDDIQEIEIGVLIATHLTTSSPHRKGHNVRQTILIS